MKIKNNKSKSHLLFFSKQNITNILKPTELNITTLPSTNKIMSGIFPKTLTFIVM
jgi:hypothetical protein